MNTRYCVLILFSFLFSLGLKGQSLIHPAIQEKLNSYIEFSNQKEWDKAFDLLYPKLFAQVSKKDLVDLMLGMESDGMSLHMSNVRITSTSVPVEEGNETFVRVEYTADLDVRIEPNGLYDSPKATQAIDEQFRNTYGQQQVKFDDARREFRIQAKKSIMAIETKGAGWSLVEINMDQPKLMESLFSPAIMQALVRVE